MRVAAALLLALPLLAGCLGDGDSPDAPAGLQAADVRVPDGASLVPVPGGFAAAWTDVALPLEARVTLPPGATMVRLVSDDGATGLAMAHAETGRRRCNAPTVEAFGAAYGFPRSCSGLAAIDGPGAEWVVRASGAATGDVRVEFLDTPLDGLAGQLDLGLVTPPVHALRPVEVAFVPSFDGVRLRVEVHVPEGEGPWPVILESSPYHDDGVRAQPASFAYFAADWARRGYAVAVADVRGFGDSGGCVEVWGPNEQRDQAVLVEWAASQPWSDGRVGFYGQSYVGTTPVEAAVQAPEALKAIIAVAPVLNAYEDWHHGGVPNGESRLSPVAYQVLTEGTVTGAPNAVGEGNLRLDPFLLANNVANGVCDPTLVARANDPRNVYDSFYAERDFKRRAGDVRAAVLYTQGFEDANVKGSMIPGWFNALPGPKLGLFGHFLHQHPPRMDTEALMLGWMEEHLKGKPIGFSRLPAASVQVDRETHRAASEWPPEAPETTTLWPQLSVDTLAGAPSEGSATLVLDGAGALPEEVPGVPGRTSLAYRATLQEDVSLAGVGVVRVAGRLEGAANAYLGAELRADGALVTWGQVNLAHGPDHTTFTPVLPGEAVVRDLPLLPTERVLRAGTELELTLTGVPAGASTDAQSLTGVRFTFLGGEDGTALLLPGVPLSSYEPMPATVRP